MCVIIAKERGFELPSKSFLKKAWDTNPDGAGIMYSNGDTVWGHKGFMSFKGFYKFLSTLDSQIGLKDYNVVLHFRIATHGSVNKENTHPFIISNNDKELKAMDFTSKVGGFAHNGILSGFGSAKSSDSMEFCKKILAGVTDFVGCKDILNNIANDNHSRFAILTPKNLILSGTWHKIDNYYCSNTYFNITYDTTSYYDNSWCGFNYYKNKSSFKSLAGHCEYCGNYSSDLKCYDDILVCDDCLNWCKKYHDERSLKDLEGLSSAYN